MSSGRTQNDTLQYQLSRSVEINDSIRRSQRNHSDFTRFERDSLGMYGAAGVSADAVLKQAEGLYIRNYGGHGGVKTLSVRGFATAQTTVTVNGIPYKNAQSGVVNFNNFYPDGYESIEVRRASFSPDLNPLGGNVNFQLKPEKTGIRLKVGAGSYGEKMADVNADFSKGKTELRASYHFLEAEDNYPFSLNDETGIRQNAAFLTQQYQFFIKHSFRPDLRLSYLASGYFNEQQVPGAVVKGNPVRDDGMLDEQDHFYFLELEKLFISAKKWAPLRNLFTVNYHYNQLNYTFQNRLQEYTNHDLLLRYRSEHVWARQRLSYSLHFNRTWLKGNNLAINFTPVDAVDRNEADLGLSHRIFVPFDSLSQGRRLSVESTFRLNYIDQYNFLPNLGLNFVYHSRSGKSEYFSHLHYGHRIPSFNELYYFGYGNADLEPEKVRSVDLGGLWSINILLPLSFKASLFYNQTLDKIISIPINPVRWSTLSIGRTRSYGLEMAIEATLGDHSKLFFSYTRQEAVDMTRAEQPYLPYTPPELASYGLKTGLGRLGLQINGNYSGWRYSLLQNGPESYLPPFHTLDISASFTAAFKKLRYRLVFEVENATDTNYEVIKSYPMPPQTFRLMIVLKY